MEHSTVTRKGQTTIPGEIRKALQIKPGDKLQYVVKGDSVTIRVHPGTRSLKGVLASKKGKKMSFGEIREAATKAALGALISSPGVQITENAIHLDALERYRKTKVHFVDCLIAATARAEDTPVAMFDEEFRKFGDVRIENG